MQNLIKLLQDDPREVIPLFLFGDTHIGSKSFRRKEFEALVKKIKEEDAYWVYMGDIADSISVSDKRYDPHLIDNTFPTIADQYEYVRKILDPIKDKGLVILTGNHDDKIRRRSNTGYDYVQLLANNLSVPYGSYSCFLTLKLGHWDITLFLDHGHGLGRRLGSKINKVTDFPRHIEADVYGMGHVHRTAIASGTRLRHSAKFRHNKIVHKPLLFLLTGSYYDGYTEGQSGYAERLALPPDRIGCVKILFDRKQKSMEAVMA